jgi:hypothetical protein
MVGTHSRDHGPGATRFRRRSERDLDRLIREGVLMAGHMHAANEFVRARDQEPERMKEIERALAHSVGVVGVEIVNAVCNGSSAANISMGAGFVRSDRQDLGDARKAHVAIRLAFDALVSAVSPTLTGAKEPAQSVAV